MMNRLIIILVLLSISTINIFAEEPQKIQIVIVSGVGVNADKAKQNAIRNAVEQVVGSYLSSETIVKNNQVLKDEILSYSGGYVKDLKIISQEMNPDGLFNVKIEAGIVSTKIIKKLESLNIATKKVEGESLFGEAVSRIDEQKGAGELLGNILSKYPQAAYNIEVGKPEIKSTDPSKDTARVSIPLTIRWDNAFIEELKDVLSRVGKEKTKMVDINAPYQAGDKDALQLCFSKKPILKSGRAEVCEIITSNLYNNAVEKSNLHEDINLFSKRWPYSEMRLLILFKDKVGNIVDSTTYKFKSLTDGDNLVKKQGIPREAADAYKISGKADDLPNVFRSGWASTANQQIFLTDGVFTIAPETDINVTTLSKAASIEVQVEPWKRR